MCMEGIQLIFVWNTGDDHGGRKVDAYYRGLVSADEEECEDQA